MPEGPEIRRAADRIGGALVGRKIRDAELTPPALSRFQRQLIGASVLAVDTRGKAMLTRFDNGLTLFSHNQLYGRWYVTLRGRPPKTRRSLRVALHTDTHSAWLYSATDIELLDDEGLANQAFLSRVGPDVLDETLRPSDVCRRLEDKRFRRRQLAGLYLDQSFLAGIGNYLRSEILFVAATHPLRRPVDLDRDTRMRLARATLRISRRAYDLKGVTVTKGLVASLKRAGQRFREYRHWVFARAGRDCRHCGTTVERLDSGGRAIFLCPTCQRRGAT